MKHITFENTKNLGWNARYQIDWQNGERRYKEPVHHVRAYECGIVEIHWDGERHPGWRNDVRRMFDLDFRLSADLGCQIKTLRNPQTKETIAKAWLTNKMFMVDYERKRLYATNGGRTRITFLSQYAQPLSDTKAVYAIPDKKAFKEKWSALDEYLRFGETLLALKTPTVMHYWGLKNTLTKEFGVPSGLDLITDKARAFCAGLARSKEPLKKELAKQCAVRFETPFIEFN